MRSVLVAGGSGGHLIPALTLGSALSQKGPCTILSTARPVDQMLQESSGLEWKAVDLERFTPLRRWLGPGYWIHQGKAVAQVWDILQKLRPDVLVGFGGYLSAVGVTTARLAGVPVLLHEQNVLPGRSNRWMARLAQGVAVSFPETQKHLPSGIRVEVTGNPIPHHLGEVSQEQARAFFGFDSRRKVLLVIGGSQGSLAINRLVLQMWETTPVDFRQEIQVIHMAGSAAAQVEKAYRGWGITAAVFPFLHEIHLAYTIAQIAISRAGATTIAELTAFGIPALLIPYPYAGAHQRANAGWMESVGAAVVVEEAHALPVLLAEQVQALLESARHSQMRQLLLDQAGLPAVSRFEAFIQKVVE